MRLFIIRSGYRLAWLALWLLSPLGIARGRGVKAILTHDGTVLLVRHTYGPRRWELPGGGLHRVEAPQMGVQREIREELGVELDPARVVEVATGPGRQLSRQVSYFAAEIAGAAPQPDRREIARAEWFAPDRLPSRLGRYVAEAIEAGARDGAELPVALRGARARRHPRRSRS